MKSFYKVALMCAATVATILAASCENEPPVNPVDEPEYEISFVATNGTAKASLEDVTVEKAKAGAVITLTADPADNYGFTGWTSTPNVTFTDAAAASTTFTMPAENITITASFEKDVYALNFTAAPAGGAVEVKVDGEAVTSGTSVAVGANVTIKATANTGYEFSEWGGVTLSDPEAAEASFAMPAEAVTLTATFNALSYSITINTPANGSIEVRVNAGEPVTGGEYPYGSEIYIKASADEDYLFTGWDIDGLDTNPTAAEHTFTMPAANLTISASFELDTSNNYVRIDGVKWAKYNVNTAGTFVSKVEEAGQYYQFNFNTAWGADGTPNPAGATWVTSWKEGPAVINRNFDQGPCPENYTVPTEANWRSLMKSTTMTDATVGEVAGKKFATSDGKELFLPYAGTVGSQYGAAAAVSVGTVGTYWSNEFVSWNGNPGPPAYARALQIHFKGDVMTSGTGTLTVKEYKVAVGDVIESPSQTVAVLTSNGTTDFNVQSSYLGQVSRLHVDVGGVYTSNTPLISVSGYFANQARFYGLPVRCVGVE
jgi:hypothetical protein